MVDFANVRYADDLGLLNDHHTILVILEIVYQRSLSEVRQSRWEALLDSQMNALQILPVRNKCDNSQRLGKMFPLSDRFPLCCCMLPDCNEIKMYRVRFVISTILHLTNTVVGLLSLSLFLPIVPTKSHCSSIVPTLILALESVQSFHRSPNPSPEELLSASRVASWTNHLSLSFSLNQLLIQQCSFNCFL